MGLNNVTRGLLAGSIAFSLSGCIISEVKDSIDSCLSYNRGIDSLYEENQKETKVLFFRQIHVAIDSNLNECLSEKGEKDVLISQNNIFNALIEYEPDFLIVEGFKEGTIDKIRSSWMNNLVKVLFIEGYNPGGYEKYLQNKEKYKDRLKLFLGGAIIYAILNDKVVLPGESNNINVSDGLSEINGSDNYTCEDIYRTQNDAISESLLSDMFSKREEFVVNQIDEKGKYAIIYGGLHDFKDNLDVLGREVDYKSIDTHPFLEGKLGYDLQSDNNTLLNGFLSQEGQDIFDIGE